MKTFQLPIITTKEDASRFLSLCSPEHRVHTFGLDANVDIQEVWESRRVINDMIRSLIAERDEDDKIFNA